MRLLLTFIILIALTNKSFSQITGKEFSERRNRIMQEIQGGILLLHARSFLSNEDQLFVHGFQQNPGFYYFTGLASTLNAILAVDALAEESWLFIPTKQSGLAELLGDVILKPGSVSEKNLRIEHVKPWENFQAFIDKRVAENPKLILYTDESYWTPPPESNPPGLLQIADAYVTWRQALKKRWPNREIKSAKQSISELRLIKSEAEIAIIRRVAEISAQALLRALKSIRPEKTQRQIEADVVCACIDAGGEGPSFWPWIMSGPNAVLPKPLESLIDYHHLNRKMRPGELVRVDIGCDYGFYKGDVGRTVPVSGKFTDAQREVWELWVSAYRSGLKVIRDGTTKQQIEAACIESVRRLKNNMQTQPGKRAAEQILQKDSDVLWHIHGSGLEPGEGRPDTLRSGMVIEFEPMFSVGEHAFYLEDMILVTDTSYEILTSGLPYTAYEIEKAMALD